MRLSPKAAKDAVVCPFGGGSVFGWLGMGFVGRVEWGVFGGIRICYRWQGTLRLPLLGAGDGGGDLSLWTQFSFPRCSVPGMVADGTILLVKGTWLGLVGTNSGPCTSAFL